MQIKGSKILITGGNSGIGKATAQLLKEQGAQVVIAGRNTDTLSVVATELEIDFIQCDVTDGAQVQSMITTAIEKMGGLDVLINNAGYGYVAKLLDIQRDEFEQVHQTNVVGAMLCAQAAAKHFINQDSGNIINIGSTSALKGSPGASPYNATKFALRGMTEAWRQELRPHNIRVMLVNPSEVMTSFAERRLSNAGTKDKNYSAAEQETKLRGQEIAHTISSLLAMDDRGFITEATVFATNPRV